MGRSGYRGGRHPAPLHRGGVYGTGACRVDAGRVRARLRRASATAPRRLAEAGGGPVLDGSLGGALRTPTKDTVDLVPPGTDEEHRGDHVHATDGALGLVHAVRIDAATGVRTAVIVGVGHLWGQHEVAIPAASIARFSDGIRLNITKEQVKDHTATT